MKNPLKLELPIYRSLLNNESEEVLELKEILYRIKNGYYKNQVEYGRSLQEAEYKKWKRKSLPAISISSKLDNRETSSKIDKQNYTGLIQLDFDKVKNPIDLREKLKTDDHILAAFISPSGKGVKGIVFTNNLEVDRHKESWDFVDDYYYKLTGVESDKSVKDVKRVLLVSYDPDIYINEKIKPLDIPKALTKKEITELTTYKGNNYSNDPDKVIDLACKKISEAPDGSKHNTRLKQSRLAGGYVSGFKLNENEVLNKLIDAAKSNTTDLKSALKDIQNGFDNGLLYPIHPNNPIDEIVNSDEMKLPKVFWEFTHDREPKLTISNSKLLDVLSWWGFKYMESYEKNKFILVKQVKNVVHEVIKDDIIHFVINDLPGLVPEDIGCGYTRSNLQEKLIRGISHYVSKDKISALKREKLKFLRDNKTESYLPFRNRIIKIRAENIESLNYDEFDKVLWEDSIIDSDIKLNVDSNFKKSDFYIFLQNTCTNKSTGEVDEDRFMSLKQCIGYLCSNYKSDNYYPCVIFTEAVISDDPEGGTGKGLINKAINMVRKQVIINGAQFNPKSQFSLQQVKLSTDIIVFDEIGRDFKLDKLFSFISDGLTIEQKHRDPFFITQNLAPKIVLNSNYGVAGDSGSFDRRRFDMELLPFYTKDHKPFDDFGKMFFSDDWLEEDWNYFYHTIFHCIQEFYKAGCKINYYNSEMVEYRKLLSEIENEEYYDYANDLKPGQKYYNATLCDDFKKQYRVEDTWGKKVPNRTILRNIKKVLRSKGYTLKDYKSNSKRGFYFSD